MPIPVKKVPARYIGTTPFELSPNGRPYFDGDGQPLKSLELHSGDVVMWEAHNVLGQTHLRQKASGKRWFLGYGHVVLPEHQHLSADELSVLGYEFDEGRPDLEPVHPPAPEPQPVEVSADEPPSEYDQLPPELQKAIDDDLEEQRKRAEEARKQAEAEAKAEAEAVQPAPADAPAEDAASEGAVDAPVVADEQAPITPAPAASNEA